MKKEIKDFLKFNENDRTTYPDLWNTRKAVLRGEFIALKWHQQFNRHVKDLERKEANSPGGVDGRK